MRTTVEMWPEHRSALLALAARRGEKGFPSVLADAIDEFLRSEGERNARLDLMRSLRGSICKEDAEELSAISTSSRGSWR